MTLKIAERYARECDFIKIISKENGGVCSARNAGIDAAQGKYIFYLDADDEYSPPTLEKVCNFFDAHYDEIDLAAIYEERVDGNKRYCLPRYKEFKTGVYDLNETEFFNLRPNIAVKNLGKQNTRFYSSETDRLTCFEDGKYNIDVFKNKITAGYCRDGCYVYYTDNLDSVLNNTAQVLTRKHDFLVLFEPLFSSYDEVPVVFQRICLHYLSWILNTLLFPNDEEFNEKFKQIMRKIKPQTILENRYLDFYHKHFLLGFLDLKYDFLISPTAVTVTYSGGELCSCGEFELILVSAVLNGECLKTGAYVQSVLYDYIHEPAEIWYCCGDRKERINVSPSIKSYYKAKNVKTNSSWFFEAKINLHELSESENGGRFVIGIRGHFYKTNWWVQKNRIFSDTVGTYLLGSEYRVDFDLPSGAVTAVKTENPENLREQRCNAYRNSSFYNTVVLVEKIKREHVIWLYCDSKHAKKDNAYHQFCHDVTQNDGVERYYLSDSLQGERIIKYGSFEHKIYYLSCVKLITSFLSRTIHENNWDSELNFLKEFETVYLQHGILHVDLRDLYHKELYDCDKIVVSSQFEIDNFTGDYGYDKEQIIVAGQPRYEFLDRKIKPHKKILFAPSWRSYFNERGDTAGWRTVENRFIKSNYYKNLYEFLSSSRLSKLLKKYDYHLVLKTHPIVADGTEYFKTKSKRITVTADKVAEEEYDIFITDFSSYQFDFVYLQRKMMFFLPDPEEFYGGLHSYHTLTIPYGTFGNMYTDVGGAIAELERLINGEYSAECAKNQAEFFLPQSENREKIYKALTEVNKS